MPIKLLHVLTAGSLTLLAMSCREDNLAKDPGNITGQFCDPAPESGKGLPRVEVSLLNTDGTPVEGKTTLGNTEGQFELKGITAGDYILRGNLLELQRQANVTVESGQTLQFVDPGCHAPPPPPAPTGGQVSGRACDVDAGAWAGFAQVWLSSPGAQDVAFPGVTQLDGTYLITDVNPGPYDLHVSKDLFALDVSNVVVTEGQTTQVPSPSTCAPPAGGTVTGQACQQGVGWVAGGTATINLAGGNVAQTTTSADGHFTLTDVPPGVQVVRVEKDLFLKSWQVTVPSGGTVTIPSPATCEPTPPPEMSGTVQGRVCAPDGSTWLAGAQVFVGDQANPQSQTTTDADGRFTLTGVPAGSQTIHVVKNSFTATYTVTVTANGTTTIPEQDCRVVPTNTRVAVVTGLYDNVRCVLTGQSDPQASMAGHQCTVAGLGLDPTHVTSIEGRQGQYGASLLGNYAAMQMYDIIFFNCGLDDTPITTGAQHAVYAANLRQFVEQGGSVYASDWAAPVIEQAFPEFISWMNGSGSVESIQGAKVGAPAPSVLARVTNAGIRAALGRDTVDVGFDLSQWVVMQSTALATRVYIRGDVDVCSNSFCFSTNHVTNVPLTVGFDVGAGRVVYTSFHQERNVTADMTEVLNLLVFEL